MIMRHLDIERGRARERESEEREEEKNLFTIVFGCLAITNLIEMYVVFECVRVLCGNLLSNK